MNEGKGTFRGGVHPYDGKDLSKDLPIKECLPEGPLVFPMSQHIGAPAKPVVAVGDKVLAGQKIAEAGGFISSPVISSVSGTVKAIEPRMTISGAMCESIVIESDGEFKGIDGMGEDRDYTKLSKQEIRDIVKEAGIVGMGGAGFPTNVKLTPKDEAAIDYILVNGAECEPYLTSDYRIMLEETERIVGGLKVMLSLFENAKGCICIEDNKPDAIAKMQEAIAGEERMEVVPLKTKYPQGAERTLIEAATGRQIYSAMLPADAGVVVDNIDTVVAIYMAVCKQTPLMRRIVTITGDAIKTPQNFSVKIGTSFTEVLKAAGGFSAEPAKIIGGGPMMGMAVFETDVPVIKTSSAMLCMTKDMVAEFAPTPCIRCGKCVEACPSRLVPQMMAQAAQNNNYELFEKLNGMECYECGSCTYVCPARRPLTQLFKQARRTVMDNRRKQASK